jgi:hypothetical protein
MRIVPLLLASCGLFFAGIPAAAQPSGSATGAGSSDKCAQLTHLTLPSATITTAKTYAARTFVGAPQNFTGADLSAFYRSCRSSAGNSRREAFSRLRYQD